MGSRYEIWILDDAGRRILLLDKYDYFSYSRSATGFGTFEIGIPYDVIADRLFPLFQPDRRIDVWRSPAEDMPMRREQMYLLRMYRIYTRDTDAVKMLQFYGRDLKDLLRRRYVVQASGTPWTRKTDYADDMMKEIVREQMLYGSALDADGNQDDSRAYPNGEFFVQENYSAGPNITYNFADRQVLETLKELHSASANLAESDPLSYQKIYFDVVPFDYDDAPNPSQSFILQESGEYILQANGSPILLENSIL